jgi:hypothetical protein
MPRTIIDIPDAQLREVDRLCLLLGISRAEAVRRGLQGFVAQNETVKTDGFGLWRSPPAAQEPTQDAPAKSGRRKR